MRLLLFIASIVCHAVAFQCEQRLVQSRRTFDRPTNRWIRSVQHCISRQHATQTTTTTALFAQRPSSSSPQSKLSTLPAGISPFEKSLSKSLDIQGDIRSRAQRAVQQAMTDGYGRCLEVEFPPLLGGQRSASQFDDFDNIQELDQNRDWCVQFAPQLLPFAKSLFQKRSNSEDPWIWLIFGDSKECQLAQEEWSGQRYQQAAKFTTIEAVTKLYTSTNTNSNDSSSSSYSAPWGAAFASTMSKLLGKSQDESANSLVKQQADSSYSSNASSTTTASAATPAIHLICQPGNGGPVEDWINIQVLHTCAWNPSVVTIVVNGALDKVRDGYYPSFAFPKLAKTIPFYQSFTQAFYLKPIYEQGLYGWLYRQYPEPWQVILQTKQDEEEAIKIISNRRQRGGRLVEERIALISEQRPTYRQAVQALVQAAAKESNE